MWTALPIISYALAALGQPISYTVLPAAGVRPSARVDGTIAYDGGSGSLYLFGGQDNAARNDLWTYRPREGSWREISPAGAKPAPRWGHTLVFDSGRRRLILFGGQASGFFGDVWAFDIAAGVWTELAPNDRGPSRRYGHSGVYDPRGDRLVISHGFTNSGRFDDTWSFDLASSTWRNITPGGARPLRRCLHHAAIDEGRNTMYLFGGCASGFGPCPLNDLWAFDLAANRWTEVTGAAKPPAREHYGRAFDSARGRLVLYGGSGAGLLNDTWEFDPRTAVWAAANVRGDAPGARSRHESAYAADRGAIFFFGGRTASGLTNELWSLTAAGPRISGLGNAFSGASGVVAPGQLVSIFGSGLGPSEGRAFDFDAATGLLPTNAAGVSVSWNGVAAPLYFARADQLNVQVPYELAESATASLAVTVDGAAGAPVEVRVAPAGVGLFPGAWNQDGSRNSAASAARAGEIVVLFATGQGVTVPASRTGARPGNGFPEPVAPVSATIGGMPAEILFRGQAPGTAGVMQINARIPGGVAAGDSVPVALTIGESSASVPIAIR